MKSSFSISYKSQITKFNRPLESKMKRNETNKAANCASQNGKAKSEIIAQIARIVRKNGLDYEDWRYVTKAVRQKCELKPKEKGRKLPKVLTQDEFRRFL